MDDMDCTTVTLTTELRYFANKLIPFMVLLITYMQARKTLRCLRGVKRVRVVGQAKPVKKQTAATLSYIQSWNKLQSEIRNQRAFMVTEGRNRKKKQENQMKLEAKLHNLQVSFKF